MAQKAHNSVLIFHSSVVIFKTVQLLFFTVPWWFSQFSCDFGNSSVVIFQTVQLRFLRFAERDWNLTYGNWDRWLFFLLPFWKAAKLSSSLCLAVLGVLNDGCYNKANCPRGNKTSGWICLYEFWSSDPWTKPKNGKPTVRIAWPHQRPVKREEKKDR